LAAVNSPHPGIDNKDRAVRADALTDACGPRIDGRGESSDVDKLVASQLRDQSQLIGQPVTEQPATLDQIQPPRLERMRRIELVTPLEKSVHRRSTLANNRLRDA
jgi:hypothetical protein